MARKITFEIITSAQTKQLNELNKLLKDVKRSADALGKSKPTDLSKALGLDKVDKQIKSVNTSMTGLNKRLTSIDKKLEQVGKNAGKLGNEFAAIDKSFTKTANSATKMGKGLSEGAKGITNIEKASGKAQKSAQKMEKDFDDVKRAADSLGNVLGDLEGAMRGKMAAGATDGSRRITTLTTDIRDLQSAISRMDSQRKNVMNIPEKMADAEEKLANARREAADAQARVNKLQADGASSLHEIEQAQKAYQRAVQSTNAAQKNVEKQADDWDNFTKQVRDAEVVLKRVRDIMDDPDMEEAIPKSVINRVKTLSDALTSLGNTFQGVGADQRRNFGALEDDIRDLVKFVNQMGNTVPNTLREVRQEFNALGRVRLRFESQDIGNTVAAMNKMSAAVQTQTNEASKIVAERRRLTDATDNWRTAELATTVALNAGSDALKEKNRLATLYTSALSKARSVETTLAKDAERLDRQQNQLKRERLDLTNRLTAAEAKLSSASAGTARYLESERQVEQLTQALRENQNALSANTANINENERAWQEATSQVNRVEASQSRLKSSMASITQEMAQQALMASRLGNTMRSIFMGGTGFDRNAAFRGMLEVMQSVNRIALELARTLGTVLRNAITAAANAARGFVNSTGSMFAGLQRALQSSSGFFRDFANNVVRSMDRARMSMLEFYAAGYSLLTVGSQIQQFGNQMFRGMGRGLEEYMNYERALLRAAGASADPVNQYQVDTSIVDEMVFQMQRGQLVPQWMRDAGVQGALPVTFDAAELAQGIYYYSAALGQPVTRENMQQVGEIVQTVMQMAKVTGTQIETAMKGVLNIAMEFGIDARNLTPEGAETIQKVTAQIGMLANMSTMEVSDIIESFKMMGPFLNLLSGGDPGAGLEEAMMAVFAASEVGLRGGNIGRGLSQAFQSLLDPTDKMIEETGKYFPEVVDEATFKEVFFETMPDGTQRLKGGLRGFFEQIANVTEDPVEQARLLAELFTSNATRGMVGVTGQIADTIGGMTADELLARLEGDDPFAWLASVAAATANSVSGWFDFMKNAWFQFTASITESISGPLMNGFRLIGEILFEVAEAINLNPRIGQTIAAIVGAIATLATIGGTVMIAAGGILLLGRAFAMLGGMVIPAIRMLLMAGVTLAGLIPLFLLIGVVAGVAAAAYQNNILGIKDATDRARGAFTNFETQILPTIERVMSGLGELGRAFGQFVNGILLGFGPLGNLQRFLDNAFGPLLGPAMMNGLLRLNVALEGTRQRLREFFSGRTFDGSVVRNAMLTLRGFVEQVFMGKMSRGSRDAIGLLGQFLGIEDFRIKVRDAADMFSTFAGQLVGYAGMVARAWMNLGGQIRDNIVRIFSGTGLEGLFGGLREVATGFVQGIIGAFTTLLGAVEWVTDKIADFADSLRQAGRQGREIMGFTVTFNGALRTLGATLGLFFGARLVLAFGPFISILLRALPLVTGLASVIVGLGGRIAVMVASVLISVAAWTAQLAILGLVTVAKLGLLGANAALAATETVAASASTGHAAARIILAAAANLAFVALTALIVNTGLLVAGEITLTTISLALAGAMGVLALAALGVVLAFTAFAAIGLGIAAALLVMVAASDGLGAALTGLISLVQGIWSGMQLGITVIQEVVSLIFEFTSVVGAALGVGNGFTALGYAIGLSMSVAVIGVMALVGALAGLAVAWAIAHAPMILFVATVAAVSIALYDLANDSFSVVDSIQGAFSALPDAMQYIIEDLVMSFARGFDRIVQGAKNLPEAVANGVVGSDVFELDYGYSGFATQAADWVASNELNRSESFSRVVSGSEDDLPEAVQSLMGYENIIVYEDANGQTWVRDIVTGQAARAENAVQAVGTYVQGQSAEYLPTGETLFYDRTQNLAPNQRENYIDMMSSTWQGTYQEVDQTNRSLLTQERIMGEISPLLKSIGIDTENLSFESLTNQLQDIIKTPEGLSDMSNFDWSILGPQGTAYDKALDNWEQYQTEIQQLVDATGMEHDEAASIISQKWMEMGRSVPTEPILAEYLAAEAEGVGQSAEEIAQALDEANESIRSFVEGMSLTGAIDLFKNLEGLGDTDTLGSILGKVGDQIIQNAGDSPWLNMTELLMDAAGTSDFDADAAGQNIHEVLRPALELTARQLGVSVDSLLADVPKFMAPEGLTNIMTGEILQVVNDLPTNVYEQLDTLGIAQGWNEFGLDWGELATYGAGMAAQGLDWNLATYLAESYGISVKEAEDALREIGIDPNIIGDQVTEMTEQAALSMDGQLQVLTADMYNMAEGLKQGANGMAIALTESELRNLPDSVKLYLASLGYVFVTSDTVANVEQWKAGVVASLEGLTLDSLSQLPDNVKAFLETVGVVFNEDGTVTAAENWKERLASSVDSLGEWESLAPEVRAWLQSIGVEFDVDDTPAKIQAWAERMNEAMNAWRTSTEFGQLVSMGQGSIAESMGPGGAPAISGTPAATPTFNIPAPTASDVTAAYAPAVAQAQTEAQSIVNAVNDVTATMPTVQIKVDVDTQPLATRLGNLFTNEFATLMIKVDADTSLMAQTLNSLYTMDSAALKIKVDADTQPLAQRLGALFTNEFASIKIKVDIEEPDMSFLNNLPGAPMGKTPSATITITVTGADTAKTAIDGVTAAATAMAVGWTASIMQIGAQGAQSNIEGATAAARAFAVGWTASIMEVGSAFAQDKINAVKNAAEDMAGTYTVTVDIVVNGLSTLTSALNTINSLPSTKTSTVTLITNNVRNNITNTIGTAEARGGRIGSAALQARQQDLSAYARGGSVNATEYALVGEWGPEIVKLPVGSYVHTARETEQMMSGSLSRNTFNVPGEREDRQLVSIRQPQINSGDTFNFYGDIHIGDKETADSFFNEIDRRAGRNLELARRGQTADRDYRRW